mmetsp:Transcript_15403/g.51909  ORF Transcript_15403/g.51909 Transcript_15403/m.51909 type:complete len:95 (+) Transcript_15403:56-340(+)
MVKKVVVEEPPPVCALSKKEAKKVEKIRSRIEYHKCRVSNFKGPCPDKAEQLASVARLEKEMAEIELGAKRRDPLWLEPEMPVVTGVKAEMVKA